MGRARKNKKANLLNTAKGDWFRLWLEDILWHLETGPDLSDELKRGKPSGALIEFLETATGVEESSLRKYLTRKEPGIIKADAKGNPTVETAIKIAKGLRAYSRRSSPLMVLFSVGEFSPHGWGVVGNLCEPGPTAEVLEIWPAIQWLVRPRSTLEDRALDVLRSDAFADLFDHAWQAWYPAENTTSFADDLRIAIEHARECRREPRFWHLSDHRLESWVEHVACAPTMYGRWMRLLDGRTLCAREVFEDEFEQWEKHQIIEPNTLVTHSLYLYDLLDDEREALTSRAREIFLSSDKLRRYADMLH